MAGIGTLVLEKSDLVAPIPAERPQTDVFILFGKEAADVTQVTKALSHIDLRFSLLEQPCHRIYPLWMNQA